MRSIKGEPGENLANGMGASAASGAANMPELLHRRSDWGHIEIERVLKRQRARDLGSADAAAEDAFERGNGLGALAKQLVTPDEPLPGFWRGSPELIVAADPFGSEADVFRELRSQLVQKALERPVKAALAVISPGRRDGKSYVAANLAACLGQLGGRTVLVDADLRTPRLHRLVNARDEDGLSSILRGNGNLGLVQQLPELPGLFFLPAGGIPRNPIELLQGSRLSLLMYELLLAFDHVVVDTPADGWGPDARLIAGKAGAALVVGRKGNSCVETLRKLLWKVEHAQVEVAGMVINQH